MPMQPAKSAPRSLPLWAAISYPGMERLRHLQRQRLGRPLLRRLVSWPSAGAWQPLHAIKHRRITFRSKLPDNRQDLLEHGTTVQGGAPCLTARLLLSDRPLQGRRPACLPSRPSKKRICRLQREGRVEPTGNGTMHRTDLHAVTHRNHLISHTGKSIPFFCSRFHSRCKYHTLCFNKLLLPVGTSHADTCIGNFYTLHFCMIPQLRLSIHKMNSMHTLRKNAFRRRHVQHFHQNNFLPHMGEM